MKISIIIPTLGRRTLGKVFEALFLNKKFDQIDSEILVVFDGKKSDNFVFDHDSLQILETGKKLGASSARNLGIEQSSGEILAFLGDDTLPEKSWLERLHHFHKKNEAVEKVLLGRVSWTEELAKDPFHIWLEGNAQFDYKNLDRGKSPNWRHFYTSNISFKRNLIGNERFSEKFYGWGFEDVEFGYRLTKKGIKIFYDAKVQVFHDHAQTLTGILRQTEQARNNAITFEKLHPEVKILPRGAKKFCLSCMIGFSWFASFMPQVRWWRAWKRVWLGR